MSVHNNESLVKNPMLIIIAITLGVILNPLNTTMLTVALPTIQNEFHISSEGISWLVASYFIVSVIFLPLIGKLSDHYGKKKIFLIGLILVGISSLLAPLSPNLMFLIGMRTIQAIGTSALYPAGIGIVRLYIEKNQSRVIATLAVFSTTSAAFGPTISGFLIQYAGWSMIFYVNFPIIITSAILALIYIPSDLKTVVKPYKWDIIGIILFGLLMTCWMVFLQSLDSGLSLWLLIMSILITFLFYFYEKKKLEPFINVVFLTKNLNISLLYVQYILLTIVFFAIILSMPTYLQNVLILNSKTAGFMMLSLSLFAMIMTPIATRWIDHIGFRIPLMYGAFIGIIGVGLLFTSNQTSPVFWLFIILAIIGLSDGILSIGTQNLLYSIVRKEHSGVASGLLMTSRFIGNILASSLYGIIFATGINDASKNLMVIVLLIVSFVMIPGLIYITKKDTTTAA